VTIPHRQAKEGKMNKMPRSCRFWLRADPINGFMARNSTAVA
jgi:hypothetical protein